VTEAARNFADCLNRVHYQNVTFVLIKNGAPFARLIPEPPPKVCFGRDLAKILARSELSSDEASDWQADLKAARKTLSAPIDAWQ
jgi:antitoxin (DNA-binding transcriptional repressor) of toxin-antitoxin stability system